MSEVIAATHPGTTAGVKATPPTKACRAEKCETRIHVGVFFDGTGNNQDWVENSSVNWRRGLINWWNNKPRNTKTQLQQRADSNVARLFRAYRDEPDEGYFRIYVNGVGTPFEEIGEKEPEGLGAAFGAGGDGRINFGMLQVVNSMYAAISLGNRALIGPAAIKALCRNGQVGINAKTGQPNLPREDREALESVGMSMRGGLLMSVNHSSHRASFYTAQFARLAQKIQDTPKPRLVEVFIDVFGFSRGAAQARVFCNWMEPYFSGSKLAGVTTHIRFLGLFDSVAAVGVGSSATSFTDGHQSWGDAPYLRISPRVRQCEHYVAMHENRGGFPLEDAHVGGVLAPNTRQFRFPGVHSDVGGGYSPLDQGRCPTKLDSEKLSQISLNLMFDAAMTAKVPLEKDAAVRTSGWDCFAVAPTVQAAYDAFIQANGTGARALRDCMMDYLAWRYAVRHRYADLVGTLRANPDDREDLRGANQTLIDDAATAQAWSTIDERIAQARARRSQHEVEQLMRERNRLAGKFADLSAHAIEILQKARSYRAIRPAEEVLFAEYCHDSYAGFKPFDQPVAVGIDLPGTWEVEGYLRYRTRYEGDDTRLTRLLPSKQSESELA